MTLRTALAPFDLATACVDRRVIQAAVLYAEGMADVPHEQLAYARFAERNSCIARSATDPVTLHAAAALVAIAGRQGLRSEAITACGHLIEAHHTRGERSDALIWQRERSSLLHADGRCGKALAELADCLAYATGLAGDDRTVYGRGALLQYAVLLAGCGDTLAASTMLHRHESLLAPPGSMDRAVDEANVTAEIRDVLMTHHAVCTHPQWGAQSVTPIVFPSPAPGRQDRP
ncbi:hypothetical protein [Winogradskya humida]|nr:hypothetical protein [Actinoplanes humidus]